jgi:hypothetical protein
MALMEKWREKAYSQSTDAGTLRRFWDDYFLKEKAIYEQLLKEPEQVITGTVKELTEKYETNIETMIGFLDGIDDSLKESNNLDDVTEDSQVTIDMDLEKLYMNMVGCNAEWLYTLPEWDNIFDKAKRDALYKKEKTSHTVVKAPKIGRNDPCPCGSGKKYKKCCGA